MGISNFFHTIPYSYRLFFAKTAYINSDTGQFTLITKDLTKISPMPWWLTLAMEGNAGA
jgi:hypothetical protein